MTNPIFIIYYFFAVSGVWSGIGGDRLPEIRFYGLRHTAATLMFKQGAHPKVVQERLGHASIVITLDTYSHVIPSMQDDVAENIDNLLV